MNSGGAQVFQAGHPRLISMKGKGKGKGALAASLAGSLFSLVPGAVWRAQGFGGMLQQLRGHKPGPGIQLTRKPAVAGQSPPRGGDQPPLPVAAFNRWQTGSANTPVLWLGEAVRNPQSPQSPEGIGNHIPSVPAGGIPSHAVPQVESGNLADASLKASKPGSEADFPDPGQAPGARPALHITSRTGKVEVAGKPAEPSGMSTEASVATNAQPSGVPPVVTPVVTTPGHRPETGDITRSSRPAGILGNSQPSHSARPSAPDSKCRGSADRMGVQVEPNHLSPGVNGKAKGLTSKLVVPQPNPRVPLTQSERVETGHQGGGGEAAAGRITNQGRLDLNQSLPDRPEVPMAAQQTSRRASPSRPSTQQPTDPRVTPVQVGGQRPSSAGQGEGGRGDGFHPANSPTNQQVSQRPTPDGDGISRDFVKPVSLGVRKSGEHVGNESPAPVTHSLPTPAPAAVEVPANLASLARMTALHYSRFVSGEQRSSVFAFDGGSLGNVQLTFQESNAGTTLHILVESLEVRQVLQRALSSLEQEWAHQGLDFSDVSVEVGDTGRERGFPGQGDLARTPAIDSVVTEDVAIDTESDSVKDYGYNTVEFVA